MIPILYGASETAFTSEGNGRLADAISCSVKEERNGSYELMMVYPANGYLFKNIDTDMFVFAKPNDTSNSQPFRIYKISTPLNGRVTINAQHISYDLSGVPVNPFSATGITATLNGIKNNSAIANDFTFWTDDTNTTTKFELKTPASARSCLGGIEGSMLDMFSGPDFGEFEWDMKTVKFHSHRGSNNGVTIRYGKNMTDLNKEKSSETLYTGVIAYWTNSENGTVIKSAIQYVPNYSSYPVQRIYLMDATSDFASQPTVTQLNNRAVTYRDANNVGVPRVNIKVSFVPLWQSEEYKNLAPLERVSLCDTVTVHYDQYNVDATAEVIETVYDVLKERYTSITLGDAKSRLSETIQQTVDTTVTKKVEDSKSFLEQAIDDATQLITGGDGGYVVISQDADGKPYEILIMDNEDKTQATNVIRMNQNGIGFSTTGYSGPFTTAWTIDGGFVADFIKSGTITAININGSNISGSVITFTQGSGQITAEASTWEVTRSGVVVETVEGVLFHGNGGFGVNARFISLDSSDSISINSTGTTGSVITHIEASNNTYRSFADFYSNVVIESQLVSDSVSYNGRLVLNPTTGSTYLYGSKHIELAADDGTALLRATGRIDIKSPTGVVVNSDKWAYLGNYEPNTGTYFSAGKEDNRVYIRTKGTGNYCKWETVSGKTYLVAE